MNPNRLISTADAVDPVFLMIFGISLLLLLGITITMLLFVVRYHRSRAPQPTSQVDSNLWLEILWIALPSLLVLAMFYYGWSGYLSLRTVPKDAITITATARMWSWNFRYDNGKTSSKLYVPAGKPVRVNLESSDVIHGFFVPAFRIKRDVVPGMKNFAWFVASKTGSYDLFCSQYCGTNHSAMISSVEALPPREFEAWLQQGNRAAAAIDGKKLAQEKGCLGCHTLDGSSGVGPSFKGIYGRSSHIKRNGVEQVITVDEAYLRESIATPGAAIVDNFPPIMPSFADLKKEEVDALITFLKGLK